MIMPWKCDMHTTFLSTCGRILPCQFCHGLMFNVIRWYLMWWGIPVLEEACDRSGWYHLLIYLGREIKWVGKWHLITNEVSLFYFHLAIIEMRSAWFASTFEKWIFLASNGDMRENILVQPYHIIKVAVNRCALFGQSRVYSTNFTLIKYWIIDNRIEIFCRTWDL